MFCGVHNIYIYNTLICRYIIYRSICIVINHYDVQVYNYDNTHRYYNYINIIYTHTHTHMGVDTIWLKRILCNTEIQISNAEPQLR